jgi:hypothetical protein
MHPNVVARFELETPYRMAKLRYAPTLITILHF